MKRVVGNWKMHGTRTSAAALLAAVSAGTRGIGVGVAVCVPFPFLQLAGSALHDSAVALGAQNLGEHGEGAFTGEVSAAMLREFGCRFVRVGHSERRALQHETDGVVAAKAAAAAASETPILYGGSVKPSTAKALFAQRDIDGALVGGASLVAADFIAIAAAAAASAAQRPTSRRSA